MTVEPDDSGGEPGATRSRDRLSLILGGLAAAGSVGLLFWAVSLNNATPSVAASTTVLVVSSSTTPQPRVTTTTDQLPPAPFSLADLVPGIKGTLYAVEGPGAFEAFAWEASGGINRWRLPPGRTSRLGFDASSHRYGFITNGGPDGAPTLFVHPRSGTDEASFKAGSFVWHDTTPGALAAVLSAATPLAGKTHLVTVTFDPPIGVVVETVAEVDPDDWIVAWNDSGFLLDHFDQQTDRSSIILLDQSGQLVWDRQASVAYPSARGDILLGTQDELNWTLRLVEPDAPGDDPGELLAWAPTEFTNVGWSTDGEMMAFLIYEGGEVDWRLEIYGRKGDLLHVAAFPWRVWDVQWSPDDRFLIMPATDNLRNFVILFYDTQTELLTPVETDAAILWADLYDADKILIDLHSSAEPDRRTAVVFESPGFDPTASETRLFLDRDANVEIWLHTSTGYDLHLLGGPPSDSPACDKTSLDGYRCLLLFPILEAQSGGFWTLIADNHSPHPVELDLFVSQVE